MDTITNLSGLYHKLLLIKWLMITNVDIYDEFYIARLEEIYTNMDEFRKIVGIFVDSLENILLIHPVKQLTAAESFTPDPQDGITVHIPIKFANFVRQVNTTIIKTRSKTNKDCHRPKGTRGSRITLLLTLPLMPPKTLDGYFFINSKNHWESSDKELLKVTFTLERSSEVCSNDFCNSSKLFT